VSVNVDDIRFTDEPPESKEHLPGEVEALRKGWAESDNAHALFGGVFGCLRQGTIPTCGNSHLGSVVGKGGGKGGYDLGETTAIGRETGHDAENLEFSLGAEHIQALVVRHIDI
jgi:hypothetical protein